MKYHKLSFPLLIITVSLSVNGNHFGKAGNGNSNHLAALEKFGDSAVYEVRFTYTGYTTLYGGPPDCPVGRNGKAVLSGLVGGVEDVDSDDDILYTGILHLEITNMDICSVMRLPNGEDKFCRITVSGGGPVRVELELYFNGPGEDSARGGYIKIENSPSVGVFWKQVGGTCETQQVDEEKTMVPNKTIASIFNGLELPMFKRRTLHERTSFVETGEAGRLEVEIVRKVH